jgi:hypothetical protein
MVMSIHLQTRKSRRNWPSLDAGTLRCWMVHVQAKIVTIHVLMMLMVGRVLSPSCLFPSLESAVLSILSLLFLSHTSQREDCWPLPVCRPVLPPFLSLCVLLNFQVPVRPLGDRFIWLVSRAPPPSPSGAQLHLATLDGEGWGSTALLWPLSLSEEVSVLCE